MKSLIALLAASMLGAPAVAGNLAEPIEKCEFDLLWLIPMPCNEYVYVPSSSETGENAGSSGFGGSAGTAASSTSGPEIGTETFSDPAPDLPDQPDQDDPNDEGGKGNASGNNGKGGNYDRTGHSDNGKGNGRGRR